jgi:hypothetical protein
MEPRIKWFSRESLITKVAIEIIGRKTPIRRPGSVSAAGGASNLPSRPSAFSKYTTWSPLTFGPSEISFPSLNTAWKEQRLQVWRKITTMQKRSEAGCHAAFYVGISLTGLYGLLSTST